MPDGQLIVQAHPDALYYLKTQGILLLSFAFFLAAMIAIVFLFTVDKIKLHQLVWVALGGAAVIVTAKVGVESLRVDTPVIVLSGDTLRVGDAEVQLDDAVEIDIRGDSDELSPPNSRESGYFRLPGARGFPPQFTGGPTIRVKTGSGQVSFQPILYGPGAYFSDSADARATELVRRLLDKARAGNGREWLAASFPDVAGEPAEPASFRTFLIIYLIAAIPVGAFLLGLIVLGIRKKFAS